MDSIGCGIVKLPRVPVADNIPGNEMPMFRNLWEQAGINEEAWATLKSDTSRPFDKPKSGRIAVKVINHLGDEVMKVFRV